MLNAAADFYLELGRRIATARKRTGLTQGRLADLLGLSRTSITNIEKGRQPVAVHQLSIIALELGVEVTELLPPAGAIRPNAEQEAELDGRRDLDSEQRAWVARVIGLTARHGKGE